MMMGVDQAREEDSAGTVDHSVCCSLFVSDINNNAVFRIEIYIRKQPVAVIACDKKRNIPDKKGLHSNLVFR